MIRVPVAQERKSKTVMEKICKDGLAAFFL